MIKTTVDYPEEDIQKAQERANEMFEGKLSMYMRYILRKELSKEET